MIEINNLTRVFKNKKNKDKPFGIKNVSFNIEDGDLVAFVGDNGAGKTTTIKSIFGEVRLTEGHINLNGEDLFKNNNLSKLAFFPDSNNIPLEMTVNEYVFYLCAANGIAKKEYTSVSEDIYNLLDLNEHKNKKIKNLSAGLKKRAIMASVLIRRPQYIFLDEPTANLDVESKVEFINILKHLNKSGVTILITSHIIEELQEIANRLVLIVEGKIVYANKFDKEKEKIMDYYKKFSLDKKLDISSLDKAYDFKLGDR